MEDDERNKSSKKLTAGMRVFISLWMLAGIAAFIASIYCMGQQGTTGEKAVGLILAILFGPFYWLYFFASPSYCKRSRMSFYY